MSEFFRFKKIIIVRVNFNNLALSLIAKLTR